MSLPLKKGVCSLGDEEQATEFLKTINYYRFKVYFRPFLKVESSTFKTDLSFEKAVQLYRFDDELRDLLFSIIGRLEVKIRTRLDQDSRLWNRNFAETKGIQGKNSKLQIKQERNNKLYTALFVIHQMSKKIGIERNVKDEFLMLLEKYPETHQHLGSIGFSRNWHYINAWTK